MNVCTAAQTPLSALRHIIWDWNGTLLNDAHLCLDIVNGLLLREGKETLTLERYRELFDIPVIRYYERLGIAERFHDLSVAFMAAYASRRGECQLFPQMREILIQIEAAGLSQSILSAYPQEMLNTIIDEHAIRDHFTRIVGHADIYAESKVANGVRLLEELGVPPEETLLIGDTAHDNEVAEELGAQCILVASGHYAYERLQGRGARVFATMDELYAYLKG